MASGDKGGDGKGVNALWEPRGAFGHKRLSNPRAHPEGGGVTVLHLFDTPFVTRKLLFSIMCFQKVTGVTCLSLKNMEIESKKGGNAPKRTAGAGKCKDKERFPISSSPCHPTVPAAFFQPHGRHVRVRQNQSDLLCAFQTPFTSLNKILAEGKPLEPRTELAGCPRTNKNALRPAHRTSRSPRLVQRASRVASLFVSQTHPPRRQGSKMPKLKLNRYCRRLPDNTQINPDENAPHSDAEWLWDNPEAVARLRLSKDETRVGGRVLQLVIRLYDLLQPDGFQMVYFEAKPVHLASDAFKAWEELPTIQHANDLAMSVLATDAEAEGRFPLATLRFLVVPDTSELSEQWQTQFRPMPLKHKRRESKQSANRRRKLTPETVKPTWHKVEAGPEYKRNVAHVYDITQRFEPSNYPGLELGTDAEWLRKHPERVGRVRVLKHGGSREKSLLLAVRVADPDAPDGWFVAHYLADTANLGEKRGHGANLALAAWRADPTHENEDAAIQSILWRDAKRVGGAAEVIFRLMLLPVGCSQSGQAALAAG
jgi:hypothetical protein